MIHNKITVVKITELHNHLRSVLEEVLQYGLDITTHKAIHSVGMSFSQGF